MVHLKVGDKAPDFTLPDSDGNEVSLASLLGNGYVVLYTYPSAQGPVCTKEACSFRDNWEGFNAVGVKVIGLSRDSQNMSKGFRGTYKLPFVVLSDEKKDILRQYGAEGIIGGRKTFVLDNDGIIRFEFSSLLKGPAHVKKALQYVKDNPIPVASV